MLTDHPSASTAWPPSPSPLWSRAIASPATEFPSTPLRLVTGQQPSALRGTLYRNGPARLERQGQRVGHWFDGDGAVLAVRFTEAGAIATYRYVQSAGYVEEEAADQFLYNGYGSVVPKPLWQRLQTQLKNAANTSVLALPDGLLALWEGGWPHRLDPETLATVGVDNLGSLQANDPYSAHPKRHPTTGEIFNFGLVAGANATLNLYRSGSDGRIRQRQGIPLNGIPLIHDFVLAGRYLVFCVPPVRLNALPAVLGFRSFSDALMWQPRRGTQLIVVAADTLEVVAMGETEPWFQWHFGKGYEDAQGNIVLEMVRYPNLDTNQYLQQVAQGKIRTPAMGHLWQLTLAPQTGTVLEETCLVPQDCEFPVVAPPLPTSSTARAATYLSVHRPGVTVAQGELFGAIARYDPTTDAITLADAGPGCYPSEPIYVADPTPDQSGGWVITVVYDGTHHRSEVWLYHSDRLNEEPIARWELPQVIPHSFHGTWQGA